jgi:hypothetical protein
MRGGRFYCFRPAGKNAPSLRSYPYHVRRKCEFIQHNN